MFDESGAEGLPGGVGLAEAIEALRAELAEAMTNAPGQGLRFRTGAVELAVEAAVTRNVGGKGGIKWWLIEAGGEVSRESSVTQTLRISLEPVLLDSQGNVVDALVSDVEGSSVTEPDEQNRLKGGLER
jgi:hypothetical protein